MPGAGETIIANGRELLTDAPGKKAEGTRVAIPPIPPFAENYELIGITAYTEPVTIYQFQPHAHLRGKDFKYTVVYPDGREETVLSVPKYDFHWQLAYELETPLNLPAGSKLVVTAHYDNSGTTSTIPAPDKEVYFRDQNQSSDEMFTPFIQYTIDGQDLSNARSRSNSIQRRRIAFRSPRSAGCLDGGTLLPAWTLARAGDPDAMPDIQATTAGGLCDRPQAKPLGNRTCTILVGVGVFSPSSHKGTERWR